MRIILLGLMILLTACASTERPLFVNTELRAPASLDLSQTRFQWRLQDKRSQSFVLSISQGDASRTIKNKLNIPESMHQQLQQLFTSHGAVIDSQAPTSLHFNVLTLHAEAKQHPLDHEVHSTVEIELNINSTAGVYRKRFKGNSSYTAPFRVDHAAVERELRHLTERVMMDILMDSHWQAYLRRHK